MSSVEVAVENSESGFVSNFFNKFGCLQALLLLTAAWFCMSNAVDSMSLVFVAYEPNHHCSQLPACQNVTQQKEIEG